MVEHLRRKQEGRTAAAADWLYTKVLRGGGFAELAEVVTGDQHSIGDAALQDTVEFEPVAQVLQFPDRQPQPPGAA